MRKKTVLIYVMLILIACIIGGAYYFNKAILPALVKEKVTSQLSELTSGKVAIENIHLSLLRGIVISGITLFEKDNPQKELCSIREASISLLIWPFFKEKKIVITSFSLKAANINLNRAKDGSFNIDYLIDRLKNQPSLAKTPVLIIKSIAVSDSSVNFSDNYFQTPILINAANIKLSTRLSITNASIEGSCGLRRGNAVSNITAKVKYTFKNQLITAGLSIKDIDLKLYRDYLTGLPIEIEIAKLSEFKADCVIGDKKVTASGNFFFNPLSLKQNGFSLNSSDLTGLVSAEFPKEDFKKIAYQGKIFLNKASFSAEQPIPAQANMRKSSVDFYGDLNLLKLVLNLDITSGSAIKDQIKINDLNAQAHATVTIPFDQAENSKPSYEGTLIIKSAHASGIAKIDKISEITSSIQFKNSDILIEDFLAKVLDTHVQAKGSLKENILQADISGDFDLDKIRALIPEKIELPPYGISGTTTVNAHISLDITKPDSPLVAGDAVVKGMALNLPENNLKFETESGRLKFDTQNENLQWHFDEIRYENANYSFDGSLKNFKVPLIAAMVTGKDLKLQTEFTKMEDILNISSLNGQFKNSKINLMGQVELNKNFNAHGTILLDFSDIGVYFPQMQETLKKTGLKGQCLLDTEISGPIKVCRLWNFKAKGLSKQIGLYGLRLDNVNFDYSHNDQKGILNKLSFDAYKGKCLIKGTLDISTKVPSYSLRGIIQDVDLALLKLDTPDKDKTFYGILGLNISANGQGNDLNNIKGKGAFMIKDGNIWEFNPLKELGTFLFAPRFKTLVFTNAQGNFFISNGFISTDNLELLGPELGLLAEGKISFQGDLDFVVNSEIIGPGAASQKTKGEIKIIDIANKAGSLTAIKITGSVKKPKYRLQPIAENIMKKLGDIFSNVVP